MTLRVLPGAEADAIAAVFWYEDRRPGLGDEFLHDLRHAYETILLRTTDLPRVENYRGREDIYSQKLKRFPYLVIVTFQSHEVIVIAVAHTRRRPRYWLERLHK